MEEVDVEPAVTVSKLMTHFLPFSLSLTLLVAASLLNITSRLTFFGGKFAHILQEQNI